MELKEVQDRAFNILVEFDRICRKYNLKYSLEGGSLLGAIKYADFVPWDDDVDVIMLREDYNKFLEIAPQEIDSKYVLQSSKSVEEFPTNYAKMCDLETEIYDYTYSPLKMNHGLFIDIFPIDNVDMKCFKIQFSTINVLWATKERKLGIKRKKAKGLKAGLKRLLVWLCSIFSLKKLNQMIEKECTKNNKKHTAYRYELCNGNKKFPPLPSRFYDEHIEVKFRDKYFFAIKEYDEFLKSRFGEDYMSTLPAESDRKPSHCSNIRVVEK